MKKINFLIIVPTLNSYRLLWRLQKSLEEQSYNNWRVVFVDANSNKDHVEYLEKLNKFDRRYSFIKQDKNKYKGIYGAMNQGLKNAKKGEWILFWGSDDWAYNKNVFSKLVKKINQYEELDPYLIIAKARYYDFKKSQMKRKSIFLRKNLNVINSKTFRKYLFLGCSPPHQGTIFSPKAVEISNIYNEKFSIAGDLNYFLKISNFKNINILLFNSNLVIMGLGGYSSFSNWKRIKEVLNIYFKNFKYFVIFPLLLRYLMRFFSLLEI